MASPAGGRRRADGSIHWVKALGLIGVLVLVGILLLDRMGSATTATSARKAVATAPTTAATVPAPVTTTAVLPPAQVKVQVLNGVLTGSLAGEWTAKLKASPGYTTESPDNATSAVATSVIYILTPGYQAEADQLAAAVGLPATAVVTTVPPPASAPIPATERSTADLVLVVGPNLEGTA
jgi:hypothetical protein